MEGAAGLELARNMASIESSRWHSEQVTIESFSPLGARRLFLLGGIALILVGMLFGDIFAVFVLHQNAAKVSASLAGAAHAALRGNVSEVQSYFQNVDDFL